LRNDCIEKRLVSDSFVQDLSSTAAIPSAVFPDSLADIDREILLLRHLEELTNQEISIITGISPQGVSTGTWRQFTNLHMHITMYGYLPPAKESQHMPDNLDLVPDGLSPVTSDVGTTWDVLEAVAGRFLEGRRRLLNPPIEDYARLCRDRADAIRKVFPILLQLEQEKDNSESRRRNENFPRSLPITRLGSYQLKGETNRSATSIVYSAVHVPTATLVIITVVPWKANTVPRLQLQFERETTVARRLMQPGIMPVLNVGCDNGYFFFVTPYSRGTDGAALIKHFSAAGAQRSRRIEHGEHGDWATFSHIGTQLAVALSYAHERGTLHNEIPPGNVFVSRSANARLQNFRHEQCAQTKLRDEFNSNAPVVPLYVAPECLKGTRDERSDIYSLGATLLIMATQSATAETQPLRQTAARSWTKSRRFLRRDGDSMPRCFSLVLQKAMAAAPARRYRSAAEFVAALRSVDATLTDRAGKPVGVGSRVRTWASRLC
jgi:hypothetical protein